MARAIISRIAKIMPHSSGYMVSHKAGRTKTTDGSPDSKF